MSIPFFKGSAYKFCSIDTLKLIIEHERLRFTRGDQFNDPYEANPYLVPTEWSKIVKEDKSNTEVVKALANEAFVRLSSKIYITCFSKSYIDKTSKLMWSHYGDSHKGVCFEIEFPELTQENYSSGDPVPIEITYCKSLRDERDSRNMESDDLPLYLATYKSDVWEYEQEIRLVIHEEGFDSEKFNKVNNGENIDVVLNINEIKKVIFGVKSDLKEIMKTVELFCNKGHLPDFHRLDINPITLETYEYDLGLKDEILKYNAEK